MPLETKWIKFDFSFRKIDIERQSILVYFCQIYRMKMETISKVAPAIKEKLRNAQVLFLLQEVNQFLKFPVDRSTSDSDGGIHKLQDTVPVGYVFHIDKKKVMVIFYF